MEPLTVELRAAKIPKIGWFAVHCWFAVLRGEEQTRWEIWQTRDVRPPSWGHLHKNLMAGYCGVGNGDSWVMESWQDIEAERLAEILETSPKLYPHNYFYRYAPGPNSNTYVQWILDHAGINHRLDKKAIGKGYLGWFR